MGVRNVDMVQTGRHCTGWGSQASTYRGVTSALRSVTPLRMAIAVCVSMRVS